MCQPVCTKETCPSFQRIKALLHQIVNICISIPNVEEGSATGKVLQVGSSASESGESVRPMFDPSWQGPAGRNPSDWLQLGLTLLSSAPELIYLGIFPCKSSVDSLGPQWCTGGLEFRTQRLVASEGQTRIQCPSVTAPSTLQFLFLRVFALVHFSSCLVFRHLSIPQLRYTASLCGFDSSYTSLNSPCSHLYLRSEHPIRTAVNLRACASAVGRSSLQRPAGAMMMELFSRDTKAVAAYRAQCTLATCPLSNSYYAYRPSLPTNAAFLALFSLSLCGFILQAALSRRFIGFTIAMVSGCILEVLGYIGRIMSYHNPFDQNGFLMQIVCLTIAPAFLAAGIYLTLSRIVITFGPENSRIKPLSYPRIFIPCDFGSLVLQALGGGMASAASHTGKSPDVGDHIMVAGLALQVFTLLLFQILVLDFVYTTLKRMNSMGEAALDPTHKKLRESLKFKLFLVALGLATVCIFIRSIYRVAELSEGWEGALIKNQHLFIGFEGAMVIVAVLLLNIFHPGWCFREGYVARKYSNLFKKKQKGKLEAVGEKGEGAVTPP